MEPLARHRYRLHTLGALATLAAGTAWADTPAPDMSRWKCEQCPFVEGYEGNVEAGAIYPSGANFSFGRYTGIDANKVYADVDATGQYRDAQGTNASYDIEKLGLPYGYGDAEVGREGRYEFKFLYDWQPTRLFETGVTPYLGVGSGDLTLPGSWVPAASTAGMTALAATAAPLKLEYDRRTAALLGSYIFNPALALHLELRHQDKDGTGLIGGSFLTQAIQLPQPIDYVTNTVEADLLWSGRRANLRVAYTGSWFQDVTNSLTFANPYLPLVPGSTSGRLALPPDNNLQQIAAKGNVAFDWLATTLNYAISLGQLSQNAGFLPYSTLPNYSTTPSWSSLDGSVNLSHYSIAIAMRPLAKLNLRASATYDGRDDHTSPMTYGYVITDTFPGPNGVNPLYSEDWIRLDGSIDYAFTRWLRLGVGGRYLDTVYYPDPVVSHTYDTRSWGWATFTWSELSVTLKGGNATRKADEFNAAALPPGENPQIAAYNYAARDQVFYDLSGSWSIAPTLIWSLEGFYGNNTYPLSQLGLQSADERRIATTFTWTPRAGLSAYLTGGYQTLSAQQNGYTSSTTPPWVVTQGERYWNVGVGGQWAIGQRWNLALDYIYSPTYANTDTEVGGVAQPFPQNTTSLNSLRIDLRYTWTPAWQLHLLLLHEEYNSNDWALNNVGPSTIPDLLAFGLQPLSDNVNLVGLTFRYQFGAGSKPSTP